MKTNLFFSLLFSMFAFSAFAQDYQRIVENLYPDSTVEQDFVKSYFDILEQHKNGNDPFLGGKGPSMDGYSIDKMKFSFIKNIRPESVDLVFFNWDLDLFEGLEKDEELSGLYEKPVYVLKNVDRKSIASQGDNNDLLTNFSYILGANTNTESIRVSNPGMEVSEEFANWKPHPDYMERSHPLRKTLNAQTLVLLSPNEDLMYAMFGDAPETRAYVSEGMNSKGGFKKSMIGVMVHEMFHVKDGMDHTLGIRKAREISTHVDNDKLVKELDEPKLVSLLSSYTDLIFKIGGRLGEGEDSKELLGKLATIVNELKTQYPHAWTYIWNYEYTEGFAEYVAAQSLVDAKLFSLKEKIQLEIKDTDNNIAYRTGTIGGLYLRNKTRQFQFDDYEDHRLSVWEIILAQEQIVPASNVSEIISNYGLPEEALNAELDSIKEYLSTTVVKE